ncbi:Fur family transcriptional regulator [Reichenbachiella ulvae]|uniref:Transcriptional repressor n=1 Tax=Reichenbachiella ulvae TaxID=2980104 RepID=A0ABT3CPM5_9BACT|nr:transcriptional repressor [Reichenbachiella ulvae]MCV9385410.1 transcriptional repressor [Reichenbachiella ulvae]
MLEEKLENRNIKPTSMRLLVLRQLIESGTAMSLKDLEARFDRADRATLFRTLKTFEEKKLIHGIDDGTGAVKYAICEEGCECQPVDQHVHFHCSACGETYCFTQSKIPSVNIPVGFKASGASMVYKGLCANCS